mgnify:CR=1 FL=1
MDDRTSEDLLVLKAHVPGHMRAGHYVRPYERKEGRAPAPHHHPKPGEDGKPVLVKQPHLASAPSTWHNPEATATFVPGGDVPREINGVPLRRWRDHPTTAEGWDYVEGVADDLVEPPLPKTAGEKHIGAGVVIEEPDGRVWLTHPTNAFGGYEATWPKGTAEDGLSLQANAIKEAFEETGLKVKIVGFIGDFERTTSVARMYRAVRVGGTPIDSGWESQAVSLAPRSHLYEQLNGWADWPIAEKIGAGPQPKKPQLPPAAGGKLPLWKKQS